LVRYGWVGIKLVLKDPTYRQVRDELLGGSISIVTTLLLITVISVVKPWNRTWWGRRR